MAKSGFCFRRHEKNRWVWRLNQPGEASVPAAGYFAFLLECTMLLLVRVLYFHTAGENNG